MRVPSWEPRAWRSRANPDSLPLQIFDPEDQFDDQDIDNATTLIKQAISGNLTTDSVQSILGSGD